MNKQTTRRRTLSIVSLLAMGIIFLTNPLTHIVYRGLRDSTATIALVGFMAPIHMALMACSIIAITQILRQRADVAGLTGGAIAIMGWAVGIRILAVGQLESLTANGVPTLPADAVQRIFNAAPIVWTSIVPIGLLFPIGVVTLGITILATGAIPRWLGALLAIGGVLFPIGRIGGFSWALVSCDLILGATFALIGWQVLQHRELWTGEEPAVSEGERKLDRSLATV